MNKQQAIKKLEAIEKETEEIKKILSESEEDWRDPIIDYFNTVNNYLDPGCMDRRILFKKHAEGLGIQEYLLNNERCLFDMIYSFNMRLYISPYIGHNFVGIYPKYCSNKIERAKQNKDLYTKLKRYFNGRIKFFKK